jgi:hypothetical protein
MFLYIVRYSNENLRTVLLSSSWLNMSCVYLFWFSKRFFLFVNRKAVNSFKPMSSLQSLIPNKTIMCFLKPFLKYRISFCEALLGFMPISEIVVLERVIKFSLGLPHPKSVSLIKMKGYKLNRITIHWRSGSTKRMLKVLRTVHEFQSINSIY